MMENINYIAKLIKAGVNFNDIDKNGLTALMQATINGQYSLVNQLIQSEVKIRFTINMAVPP